MNTKYAIAATFAVLLATAGLAYGATQYQSKCINDSDFDIDVQIVVIAGLTVDGLIHIVKHTVQTIVYTLAGLVAGLLGLTWKVKCIVDGVLHSVDVVVPLGAEVRVYAPVVGKLCLAVNGVIKVYFF
ncbi:hypothetical protein MPTK1_5g11300 [Marchantia polymorpha subsp. ruderalis]|uniref:TMhelix containing protein n=2 Tax=Marchantia polymorpha TaxID=3197 RepID=A0AAF6BH84_MARPO|nr:hypothetical protein MARPO_0093s0053 [Marchantia polymorpha]BBN11368.1 hypothetical protein Mp_5g11300 [Marchantia polymorpha subsp. ruderalis]|eukprot:PTQ32979.1 hypothetical protein MARPO_0093s0053 [Marchantia polymorpha]